MKELLPVQTEIPHCFGCGRDNPSGMKLRFTKEDDQTVSTRFTPPKDWTGWAKMLHGGFNAVILDEVMAWTARVYADEVNFVTTKLELRYLRPAYVEQEIMAYGRIVEIGDKNIKVKGWINDTEGNKLTEATTTIKRINPEKLKRMMENGRS